MKARRANSNLLYALTVFSLLNFACGTANNQAIVLPVPPPKAQEHQRLQLSSSQRSPRHSPTPLVTEEQAGVYYEAVLTIPVGEAGVTYRGVDTPGMDITGPNALAVLSDMSVVVADLIGNRLLRYDPTGKLLGIINLYAREIVNIWDLVAFKDELILLEISLDTPPERYRVNRLTSDGKLLTSYDIPKGYHLQDGLTGISVDCEGQILLEIKGGQAFYPLVDPKGNLNARNGYLCNGKIYRVESTQLVAGNVKLETQLTTGLGGLKLLGVLADGSVYVVREDVVAQQPVITVDQTVHYVSADGLQLGVARVPITEAYYYVMRNLAVGPDGYVYALLPRPDAVHIVRLKLFKSIAPLVPNAVAPLVTRSP